MRNLFGTPKSVLDAVACHGTTGGRYPEFAPQVHLGCRRKNWTY